MGQPSLITMLDQDFYSFLEYHFSKCLAYSSDENLKGFWCDGVMLPLHENEYSIKSIKEKKQVELKAFLGIDGQDEYSLFILFGPQSLHSYDRGVNLKDCIPGFEEHDWYFIDKEKKQVTIQLY